MAMELSDLFNILHNAVEAQGNGKKISQKEMADSLGISMRTYQDWRLGNAKPQAARVVMQMLGRLDDDDIIRVIRKVQKMENRH
jgi:DNA-binding transcriptional regulator YiaG